METKKERIKYVLNSIFLLPFTALLIVYAAVFFLLIIATSPVSIAAWVCTGKNYPEIFSRSLFEKRLITYGKMFENSIFQGPSVR
jgi:ABC-type bacteriocin/lantibiotic exporter with double-glycine peptidase domain